MSLRSSILRSARPALARTRATAIVGLGRRAASSAHGPSSNMPWALGSAAVFGSLTAFILMPAGHEAAHTVHESVEAKGAGAHTPDDGGKPQHEGAEHSNARDLMRKERASGDRPTLDDDPKGKMVHANENRPRTEIPSKRDDEKSSRRGASTGEGYENGTVDGSEARAGVANKSSGSGSGSAGGAAEEAKDKAGKAAEEAKSKAGEVAQDAKSKADEVAQGAKGKAGELADSAKGKAGELADKAGDVAESARGKAGELADKAGDAVDKAKGAAQGAVDKAKGVAGDAAESVSSKSDRDADAPSKKDIADSIKQAARSNAPYAAMDEEAKESKA